MAEDNHIPSHMQSASQETQIQQQQMDLSQIQQQHIQQNQIQQVHIQQLPVQQQSQFQQQTQIQQQQQQQQQQIQQLPVQQSQIQQEAANANMSSNNTVQQANHINASQSLQYNVATVNASQTQQVQTFPQNVSSNSGASVQIASPQIVPQIHSLQGGNMISQASASYPIMHSTVSMAQSPMQQNIVNSNTLTASGQVVGTVAKANFPQPIMPAPAKTIIQNQSGFIRTAFISQSQPFNHGYSSVPVSSAQVYNTNQVKQISSQPQILQMPGTVLNPTQIFALPQGLTWAPISGNFPQQMYAQNHHIIFPSQQPSQVFIQSPQNTVQMPASAIQTAMPATTFAVTTNVSSRSRSMPKVRPGIQTVAVATQTMGTSTTVNLNAPPMRPQIKPKNKIALASFPNGYVQPVTQQVVAAAAQTQSNQSLPQFHPPPVSQSDSVPKPAMFSKTKPASTQSKSVEVDTKQLSHRTTTATETRDMASHTEVQSVAPLSVSSTISTVTASSIFTETVVNPFFTTAHMPSTCVNTTSVVTSTTSVVPIINSTFTVSVAPVVTPSVVQESTLRDTSLVVQEKDVDDTSSTEISKSVNTLSHMQTDSSVSTSPIKKESSLETLVTLCSETPTMPTSLSKSVLDSVHIEDSDIVESVSEPMISEENVFSSKETTCAESISEKPVPQLVSPVKEKPRQRAIVKPQVLTHVIDGFVIQEGPEPFPVRQSSLPSSDVIKPSAECKKTKDNLTPAPEQKEVKVSKPRGRPRKRRMSVRRTKEEQIQNPGETADKSTEESKVQKVEIELVQDKVLEKVQEPVTVKTPAEELVQIKESTEEKHEVQGEENDFTKKLPEKWSVEDVFEFIRSMPGCEESANEFKAQEIDGQALLLLEADHIMRFMSMTLGRALKLISKIDSMKKPQLNT